MIPEAEYTSNLVLAQQIEKVPGCIVECGVWRGGMSAGLAAILGNEREYFLFDSFQGLPPAQEIDGTAALRWQKDAQSPQYYNNCSADEEIARQAMTMSGAKSFQLVKGWFEQTLPAFSLSKPVALLRLDGDWYDSTLACLETLFDSVVPNGIIILDDYYIWDGCSRALHDFLSGRSSTERIRSFENLCYLRKSGSQ